ncbi:hypothetical protein AVEN_207842-1 [Araneus ventricosus]|uniref:Uncharacterized protein n=1 Tax=Araneus ventricosus TaxID=182803 RepID=A0A4Y2T3N3_ARAVE|nr:hypothetical protein AVEN_207842-1 [Araneus ventricosus]
MLSAGVALKSLIKKTLWRHFICSVEKSPALDASAIEQNPLNNCKVPGFNMFSINAPIRFYYFVKITCQTINFSMERHNAQGPRQPAIQQDTQVYQRITTLDALTVNSKNGLPIKNILCPSLYIMNVRSECKTLTLVDRQINFKLLTY